MPIKNKENKESKEGKGQSMQKITEFTFKAAENNKAQKRSSSLLSPNKNEMRQKKANTVPMEDGEASSSVNIEQADAGKSDIEDLKGVLLKNFKSFRESVDRQYCNLKDEITMQKQCVSEELHKIEDILSQQETEIKKELANKINQNDRKLHWVLAENTLLKRKTVV